MQSRPLEIHYIDYATFPPLCYSLMIYVLVDAESKILAAKGYDAENIENILDLLRQAWEVHGTPDFIYCDSGAFFRSAPFREAMEKHGIQIIYRDPKVPLCKGKAERALRKISMFLKKEMEPVKDLEELNNKLTQFLGGHENEITRPLLSK